MYISYLVFLNIPIHWPGKFQSRCDHYLCISLVMMAGDKITSIITEDAVNSGMRAAADHSPSASVSRQSRNLHRPGKIPDV